MLVSQYEKMLYLSRFDKTSFGAQVRKAIERYISGREKTIYPKVSGQ